MAERVRKERRCESRREANLFCLLDCLGKQYRAVVLDVSPSGLFVRTTAVAPLGTPVHVTLRFVGAVTWELRARVAREPQANCTYDPVPARGLGLRIIDAPEGFAEFVESI
jgi:hypothetical protein